jgi:type III pantothenate kinase
VLFAIDVGNTNVVLGVFEKGDPLLRANWRLATQRDRTADDWNLLLAPLISSELYPGNSISGVILSSVVPAITESLSRWSRNRLTIEPVIVNADLDLGINVKTDVPAETGADRICNSVAAYAQFGGPVIVVDLGTATKIEAITESGDYLGGVIAPGIGIMIETLAARAARLYAVKMALPSKAIGSNTITAVQSGVVAGHLAMIEGLVHRVSNELGGARHVVLSGGYSPVFAGVESVVTDIAPNLTLDGLRIIFERNSP